MESLPLIPGYAFHDPTVQDHKLKQKFDFLNGFRVVRDDDVGRPADQEDLLEYDPSLTYGRVQEEAYPQFVPRYALFAQKCLSFRGFFREGVFDSPNEHFRIRHVNIVYFLEDDTMTVTEPRVENAGLVQGRLVRRGRIPKNARGDAYHWKDLNVGIDLVIYGVGYHTVDCDPFTAEFLRSQGIDPNDKEEPPPDPYIQLREGKAKAPSRSTPVPDDSRRRFLEFDGAVLSFTAFWNDDLYRVMYFLTDDTIAVREIRRPNDGKDPVALLLKRTKLPKNWKDLPSSYPSGYMERGDEEVVEYYTPKDLRVGETIFVYGRRFLLCDCDPFTRRYYSSALGMDQPARIDPPVEEPRPPVKFVPPPHQGIGSPEDTLATCLSFVPKRPRKDAIRQLFNFPKKLRYSMRMEAVHPEDEGRDFVLEYNLSDGGIVINEVEKRNSGRRGGCFLSIGAIPKPDADRDNPEFYTPEDFFIGARINVYNTSFVITGADLFVYRYMEANPEKFCRELRDNVRDYLMGQGLLRDDVDAQLGVRALERKGAESRIEEPAPSSTPRISAGGGAALPPSGRKELKWADQVSQ